MIKMHSVVLIDLALYAQTLHYCTAALYRKDYIATRYYIIIF